jgi:hypothetical protein
MVAWYCASSSVKVGMVDVESGGRAEKKCMLVGAWFSVESSSVVSGCVAAWFMMFSLRRHNRVDRMASIARDAWQ